MSKQSSVREGAEDLLHDANDDEGEWWTKLNLVFNLDC
jgi:hypothetical protein